MEDLDEKLQSVGSRLIVCEGKPCDVFDKLHKLTGFDKLTIEQVSKILINKTIGRKYC